MHIETNVDTILQRLKKRYKKQSRLELEKTTTDFVDIVLGEKRKIEHLLSILDAELSVEINTIQTTNSEDIHTAAQQIAELCRNFQ
jgi:hypothetical protein